VDCDEDCDLEKVDINETVEDNVFICGDTQVILRINTPEEQEDNGMQNSPVPTTTTPIVSSTTKLYSKRMTRRITSTIQMASESGGIEECPGTNKIIR